MTLTDAGPIFALVDASQQEANARCSQVFENSATRLPLLTTWPCLAEVMYLAHRKGGWRMQARIQRMLSEGALRIGNHGRQEQARILTLMEQYRDTPMDLADASLVVLAERHGLRTIFTLDSHFYAYQLADGSYLTVVP